MTVKDIVVQTLALLGFEEKIEKVGTLNESDADKALTAKLCGLVSSVVTETAAEFIAPIYTETVAVSGGFVPYASLSKQVKNVVGVSIRGKKVPYEVSLEGISVLATSAEITYRYVPTTIFKLTDETGYAYEIPKTVLAYGTAAEYYTVGGDFAAANEWRKRYVSSAMASRKTCVLAVKERMWI